MKKTLFLKSFIAATFFCQCAWAQTGTPLKMITDPKPWENTDMQRLADWQDIDYQKVRFTGKQLKGKNYYIVSKEIWKGEITKTDTIYKSGKYVFQPVQSDTLGFSVMGGRVSEKMLRAEFIFDRFSVKADFDCKDTDEYSFRALEWMPMEQGKAFYAFAYILPYEKGEYKYYCAVEGSGKDIEKWWQEFGIEHYILFEMKFY